MPQNFSSRIWLAIVSMFFLTAYSAPATAAQLEATPLKVGIIASHFTATGPSWIGSPYGIGHAHMASDWFKPEWEAYAVIEPGTEKEPEVAQFLNDKKLTNRYLNGYDPEALKKLDIIVSNFTPDLHPEMIKAITQAVENGTCLFTTTHFGIVSPGYTDEVCKLLGMKKPNYVWHPSPVKFMVVINHPLLKELKQEQEVVLPGINGPAGELVDGATSLLYGIDDINAFSGGSATNIQPLYYHKLGKGTVLSWLIWGDPSSFIPGITGTLFNQRCMDWLMEERAKIER